MPGTRRFAPTAIEVAAERIGRLGWYRPNVTLIDGRGFRFTPWSTDPAELARVTLHGQGQTTYDFAAGSAWRCASTPPMFVLLAGPGGSLGAACAQLVVVEGYRGLRSRATSRPPRRDRPLLLSLRR